MSSVALAPVRILCASPSSPILAIRPYVLRFVGHDGTRSVVAFANRSERDERRRPSPDAWRRRNVLDRAARSMSGAAV
jgi:hypothetical protein